MPVINIHKSFIASDIAVMSLFDLLNKNLFESALDGITLKWLNGLKTRTAVGVTAKLGFRTKTFICLSRTLLEKCTHKQLVESLLVRVFHVEMFALRIQFNSVNLIVIEIIDSMK